MPNNRAGHALMAQVQDLARGHFGSEGTYLARGAFGNVLLDKHVSFLEGFDPERLTDAETVKVLLEISKITDCVQDGEPVLLGPERAGGFVSDRYRDIARRVEFARRPLNPQERVEYDRAMSAMFEDQESFVKTEAYERFALMRSEVSFKQVDLLEKRRQLQGARGPETEDLNLQIQALEEEIESLQAAVDALDLAHDFTAAERIRREAESRAGQFPDRVRMALDLFDQFLITDPSSNETHVMCSFYPAGLSEDNWVTIRLTKAELENLQTDGNKPALEELEILDKAEIEAIELDVQMLAVERPWFWPGLFQNRQWRLAAGAVQVSNGAGEGLLPAYVSGLVFSRNLRVYGSVPERRPSGRPVALQPGMLMARPAVMSVVRPSVAVRQPAQPRQPTARMLTTAHFSPALIKTLNIQPGVAQPRVPTAVLPQRQMKSMLKINANAKWIARAKLFRTVSANVTSTSGRAIAGARVTIKQGSRVKPLVKKTDANGKFQVSVIGGGKITIDVRQRGFQPQTRSLNLQRNTSLTIRLTPASNSHVLTVDLLDPLDKPYTGNATIVLKPAGNGRGPIRQAASNASNVRIPLPAGSYEIEVSSVGAKSISVNPKQIRLDKDARVVARIDSGLLMEIAEPQLLGFVCRQVPRAPDPGPGTFE